MGQVQVILGTSSDDKLISLDDLITQISAEPDNQMQQKLISHFEYGIIAPSEENMCRSCHKKFHPVSTLSDLHDIRKHRDGCRDFAKNGWWSVKKFDKIFETFDNNTSIGISFSEEGIHGILSHKNMGHSSYDHSYESNTRITYPLENADVFANFLSDVAMSIRLATRSKENGPRIPYVH